MSRRPTMTTFRDKALKDPDVQAAYDALSSRSQASLSIDKLRTEGRRQVCPLHGAGDDLRVRAVKRSHHVGLVVLRAREPVIGERYVVAESRLGPPTPAGRALLRRPQAVEDGLPRAGSERQRDLSIPRTTCPMSSNPASPPVHRVVPRSVATSGGQ